jgi:hypothetical protein
MQARFIHVLVVALAVAMMVPAVPAAGQQAQEAPSLREQLQVLGKQFVPKRRPSAAVRRGDAAARG